jgi:hypothetical protein
VCGVASSVIGSSKGRDGCSWALAGFLLGPIGVLMAIGVTSQQEGSPPASAMRKCPMCAEMVCREAIKCRYCGAEHCPVAGARAGGATGPSTRGTFHRSVQLVGLQRRPTLRGVGRVWREAILCGLPSTYEAGNILMNFSSPFSGLLAVDLTIPEPVLVRVISRPRSTCFAPGRLASAIVAAIETFQVAHGSLTPAERREALARSLCSTCIA